MMALIALWIPFKSKMWQLRHRQSVRKKLRRSRKEAAVAQEEGSPDHRPSAPHVTIFGSHG